jgi:hypothetical protein
MDWSIVSSISSAVIALAALIFSVQSFRRQQQWSEKNARANVRPFFWLKLQNYTDLKSIILCNEGVGPAIITAAEFTKDGRSTSRLVDLMDLEIPLWETFTGISRRRVVPPHGEVVLLRQSLGHLIDQGIDADTGLHILERLQRQRRGIEIHIDLEDIYGNVLDPYHEVI